MDSIAPTLQRTAAASALAARHLARTDAATLAIIGCGDQARPHVLAIAALFRLRRLIAVDLDDAKAQAFAAAMAEELSLAAEAESDARVAAS